MSQIKDFYIIRLNVADTCKYHTDTLADIDKATPEALCIGAFVPAYRQAVADLMGVVNPEYATMFVNNSHACGAGPILFFCVQTCLKGRRNAARFTQNRLRNQLIC